MCANFTVPTNGAPTGECGAWGEQKSWDGQIGVLFKEVCDRAQRARYVASQTENKNQTEKSLGRSGQLAAGPRPRTYIKHSQTEHFFGWSALCGNFRHLKG